MILFELGMLIGIAFFLGFLLGSACSTKEDYIYAKKLRRFKIKCDFEDFMRDFYKSHPNT